MKLQNTLAFGLGMVAASIAPSVVLAQVSNPINEDLFFANGVQLEDVTESSEGVASVTLEGSGSITVGSQATGGFPRVSVSTGTTITSTRNWPAETIPKTSWDGQLSAPGSGRLPSREEISFSHATNQGNDFQAIGAYVWGLSNESFTFTSPARFVFPTDEPDGQRIWYAAGDGSNWTVNSASNYCIVDSGLCYLEFASFSNLALVKQVYSTCPKTSINNGSVGSVPNCIVTCDPGYYIDAEGNECLADAFSASASSSSGGGLAPASETESSEEALTLDDLTEAQQAELALFAQDVGIDPLEILAQMPGNVRLRESGVAWQRYLPEYDDLTEEELAAVRHANLGYLSRNPRSAEEQLSGSNEKDPALVRQEETSFMNYLLQMRANFAARDAEQIEDNTVAAEAEETGELVTEETEMAETFHSAGGKLLPSTGPGLFMMIAIVGFLLMLFGGIRRN